MSQRSASGAGAALVLACLALWATPVRAQDPYGPGVAPMGAGGPPASGGEPKPSDVPETHAASGATDSIVPEGNEPALPAKPLKTSKRTAAAIGSDLDPADQPQGVGPKTERQFYGLYYNEQSGEYRYRVAFPVWAERLQPSRTDPKVTDRASLFGGLYYNRRSAERADDVLFPLVWNLNDKIEGSRTTIVGPFVNRVTKTERDDWLLPLYATGQRPHGGYTLIPPLLTYLSNDAHGGFNLVGPAFCSWKGGQNCDTRTAHDIDLGVFPLYFFGQNQRTQYEIIPPLLHYYRYNDRDLSWTNVWGPYYRSHTEKRDYLHLLPLYWSIWGKNERHTTVFPFFHYGYKGEETLFVNPLYLQHHSAEGDDTFVSWLYARHRGRTELDMITPLYWHYRDPTIDLDQKLLFPFLYTRTSPRESNTVFFPFWAHFERYGVSESTWITPFFQHKTDLRGWQTNIHPILYLGRDGNSSHTVVAPVFWDFASPTSRSTVVFPFYWRFAKQDSLSQLIGNVYYSERKYKNGLDWQVHFFPVFSYGETPDGHWWNLLYGLAGYKRQGTATSVKALWVPIGITE
ncbi:MAG TPA: hypothetical protein VI197_18560 [Polyangiaceae bacterium]